MPKLDAHFQSTPDGLHAALVVDVPLGVRAHPLRTVGELKDEALRMRHCVWQRVPDGVADEALYFHLELPGTQATVELRGAPRHYHIAEARGPQNAPLSAADRLALEAWLAALNA